MLNRVLDVLPVFLDSGILLSAGAEVIIWVR